MITDQWNQAEAYERYIGRWSRPIARGFVSWLKIPPEHKWMDVGCGTGALSALILASARPRELIGIDRSTDQIASAQARLMDRRARFIAGDALALPMEDDDVDVAVSGLMLNFITTPERALDEMVRVTRPGGMVATYVWDYVGGMEMIRHFWAAARDLDPAASELDEAVRFPLCHPDALLSLFRARGLSAVEVTAISVPTDFRDFDDFWTPFLGGQGPAPSYVQTLTGTARLRLRDHLRESLLSQADGSIRLLARAWAIKGRKRT